MSSKFLRQDVESSSEDSFVALNFLSNEPEPLQRMATGSESSSTCKMHPSTSSSGAYRHNTIRSKQYGLYYFSKRERTWYAASSNRFSSRDRNPLAPTPILKALEATALTP